VGDDKMYIMSETGRGKWEKKDCSEFKKTPPPNLRNIVPVHYNQRYYDI